MAKKLVDRVPERAKLQPTKTRGLAYVNHGRWLADCLECGSPLQVNPERSDQVVCGACYPGIFAVLYVEVTPTDEDRRLTPGIGKAFRQVPDPAERRRAFDLAKKQKVIFPPNAQEIMETLRPRLVQYMNWLPGETIEKLIAENIENGVTKL